MSAVSPEAKQHNREVSLASYYSYKEHGICFRCKTRYAEPGRIYCKQCKQRIKALADKRDPGAEKRKAKCKEWRDRLKALGLCADCGQRPAREGITRCAECARKANESRQVYRIRQRIARENGWTAE